MTIKQARKLLGKEADWKADEEIEKDIEVAKFFIEVFFDMVKEGKIKTKH